MDASRAELRRKHGVPEDQFVVLSVCAVNREQKRVDYLIEELAALDDQSLLWVDGQAEDPSLLALGAARLGARFRNSQVPSEQVGELYALADVFVLGSLQESFGLALVEAMCSGLPSVMHDSPHFRWLAPADEGRADLTRPGALRARLARLRDDPGARQRLARAQRQDARARYDWSTIGAQFVALYQRLATAPRGGAR